ncbi:hypothetical protein CDD82_7483 [Ophiocordyceps australis]|uniref:HbrB-like protein n=1 Tax=Ophiocordyceps australis TaxID=1399860 RepID=A0A2C5ZR91_9HYPO|nr:hypothetical protein CDD82_7483 [Ophiocordyceps australis]
MQPGHQPPSRPSNRAPGSFAPLPASSNASAATPAPLRPPPLLIDAGIDQDTIALAVTTGGPSSGRGRWPEGAAPATPIYNQFSASARPSAAAAAAASQQHASPGLTSPTLKSHSRKHSATQGFFDSTLPWMTPTTPTASSPSVPSQSALNPSISSLPAASQKPSAAISTSQMAAKAAVISHQNPSHQNLSSHVRQRSQTVPFPGDVNNDAPRRGSGGGKAPLSPPLLSLTEASAPRESVFSAAAGKHQMDRAHSSAATAAANVVFPRSAHGSPRQKAVSPQSIPPVPPIPPPKPEKPSKVKLFSRPGKIGTSKADAKDKALPSPSKIGTALSVLQRGNFSTTSLVDPPAPSLYSLTNSSTATIRPVDTATEEKEKEKGKEKEKDSKKHHFLSRQKQKLKDEYHLPLSSAASNSRPTDPSAPSSLYNFNLPGSPGPGSANFVKAKREKKLAEKSESRLDSELNPSLAGDRIGPTGLPPQLSQQSSLYDPIDFVKLGLQSHVSLDDAWPYLKAKLLVVFEGEDLRIPVEDFNRFVQMHIQWCMHRRNPGGMLDDIRDLLTTGFSSLDRTLRLAPEDRFVPTLVELWLVTFTSILPYMQSVFLPLELEVSGSGIIMTAEQARDFWSGLVPPTASVAGDEPDSSARMAQAASLLDVRRLVLTAYRDTIILPRYETLKSLFSRLSLEFLPSSFAAMAMASSPPEANLSASPSESLSSMVRPGTAMSLDPSVGSYTSTGTTLLGDGSERGRSRAVSNVSYGSHGSDGTGGGGGGARPFTPSGVHMLSSVREQNVEDSKTVTDMVGRMLQCMSVLSSLGCVGHEDDESCRKMVELCKMLKLNWLGRGRTGRNRRGIVGGRVRRDGVKDEVRVA